MLYVINCEDKPDSLEVRLENREAHLDYLKNFQDCLIMAGPFLDAKEQPIGSMLIMEFANEKIATDFSAGDPYNLAGLFQSVTIRPWRQTLPA
jgi:uncharacterized protein YciI